MPILKRIISLAIISVTVVGLTACSEIRTIETKAQQTQYEKALNKNNVEFTELNVNLKDNTANSKNHISMSTKNFSKSNLQAILKTFKDEEISAFIATGDASLTINDINDKQLEEDIEGFAALEQKGVENLIYTDKVRTGDTPSISGKVSSSKNAYEFEELIKASNVIINTDLPNTNVFIRSEKVNYRWETNSNFSIEKRNCILQSALAIIPAIKTTDYNVDVFVSGITSYNSDITVYGVVEPEKQEQYVSLMECDTSINFTETK